MLLKTRFNRGKDYPNEIYWGFYKIDMNNNTLQFNSFSGLVEGDPTPELSSISTLFNEQTTVRFEIVTPHKIKVPKIKSSRVKRSWTDFATPGRSGGKPAQLFFINGDTFYQKKGKFKFTLDNNLTSKFNLIYKYSDSLPANVTDHL